MINPSTGAADPAWTTNVENRVSGGKVSVRGLDVGGGYLYATGAFTHFASADQPTSGLTSLQLERFLELAQPLPPGLCLHASGSSALITRPDARLNMVRAGISLYGYPPVPTPLPFLSLIHI